MHIYSSLNKRIKNVYININTLPEPGLNTIRYMDPHINIAKQANNDAQIIDREKIEKTYSMRSIGRDTYNKTIEVASIMNKKLMKIKP